MEHINAETAHEQHILDFRAMCAKMIDDAVPGIKEQCMEECKQELKKEATCGCKKKDKDVEVRLNFKDIEK